MLKRPKVAVVGAGGNVGAAVVQWCAQKELADLALIDLKPDAATGRSLDLAQAGSYGGFQVSAQASSDYALMEGADVVVVTAGVPRKPGQTREELVTINAKIVKDVCTSVTKYAPQSVLIIVSNPLDAMLAVAQKVTGFPRERVIGMSGVLDSSRFRHNIAQALNVHVKDVSAIVMGAHTDKDMVPIVSTATVGGIPLTQLLDAQKIAEVVEKTKQGGAALTGLIGTSAWIAPGLGVSTMVESILLNQGRVLPCSVELRGEYGINDGSCLCVPAVLNARGASKVWEVPLSADERAAFHASHQALLTVRKLALEAIS